MATYPAAMDVAICNTPMMMHMPPDPADIMFASRTTTGTLFTVPAGRIWKGSVSLAASISVAGNATCSVSAGAAIHQLPLVGLALVAVSSANTVSDVYISGGASGQAVTFTAGTNGNTAASAAGVLL